MNLQGMRSISLSTAILAGGLFAFTACKKSGTGASSKAAASAISHLPKDSTMVFGISVVRGLKAKMLQPVLEKAKKDMPPELAEVKEKCGIDMLDGGIKSATVAMKDPNDQKSVFAAISTSFNKEDMASCMTKMGGKVEEQGKLIAYTTKDGDKTTAFWAEDNMMIVNPSGNATEADFAPVFAGGLDKNAELSKLMGDTKTSSVLWFAGVLPAEASGQMPGAERMRLSIDGDAEVDIDGAVIFADEAKATEAKGQIDQQMGMASMVLGEASKKIKIGQSSTAVTITATFNEADVEQITKSIQNAMKMMGGGM